MVIALAFWVNVSRIEWVILILTIAAVWTAELTNTAIETVVDLASPEQKPLAKIAKDVAAGAVLVTAIAAILVGLLLLGPPLWHRFIVYQTGR
jgi:diacylglycerol kinase